MCLAARRKAVALKLHLLPVTTSVNGLYWGEQSHGEVGELYCEEVTTGNTVASCYVDALEKEAVVDWSGSRPIYYYI